MTDFYEILELDSNATKDDIKKAYRRLALKYHPDKNPDGEERFKQITEAYETLSDESKKAAYDQSKTGHWGSFGGFSGDAFRDFKFNDFTSFRGGFGRRAKKDLDIIHNHQIDLLSILTGEPFEVSYPTEFTNKTVRARVDLRESHYQISKMKPGLYSIKLRVRGHGNTGEISTPWSTTTEVGDLILNLIVQTGDIELDNGNIIHRVPMSLKDALFPENLIFEAIDGKKYRIKSFNTDDLSQITININDMGIRNELGTLGRYIFKPYVTKPDLSALSDEERTILVNFLSKS